MDRKSNKTRINKQIRCPNVRVVDAEGNQLGIMESKKALGIAEEQGLDLVEVSPHASPPVCRLMDYGKYKYDQSKKLHKKKSVHSTQTKEVKLRPFTGEHDLEVKVRHILEFLDRGSKVKITVVFRGREMRFKKYGRNILGRIVETLEEENGVVEREPIMEGRNMVMMVAPKKTT